MDMLLRTISFLAACFEKSLFVDRPYYAAVAPDLAGLVVRNVVATLVPA